MAVVHRSYSGRRQAPNSESSQRVSPLIILQARFQQKQLQEKEEKLLKLYEEQQERALKSVGSHSQSGGSSVSSSSSVGVGKVRHMFQCRRGNSESRLGAAITGRDKSYPLEPLAKHSGARHLDSDRSQRFTTSRAPASWGPRTPPHQRSVSLDRNDSEFSRGKHDQFRDLELDENRNRRNKSGVRRTQSQLRNHKPKSYFGGSHAELEQLDNGQSFQLVDDHYERRGLFYEKVRNAYESRETEEYFVDERRSLHENRWKSEQNNNPARRFFQTPSGEDSKDDAENNNRMEGRYKSYVSQSTFARKPHLGNGTLGVRQGVTTKQVTEVKETTTSGYLNGTASSPVRKIRKPTPVPLSVAPSQHLLQKEIRKTARVETIKEVPSSISSTRGGATRTPSTPGSFQKPSTAGRTLPSGRLSQAKTTTTAPSTRSAPSSDLVNCRICGRHFAADRVSKHEEVCQKSSRNKRKPFDALQQRVKGTEVEQFIKKTIKPVRAQPEKVAKPQSNWRKKHEEFINNIRAAKEVSAHLKKGGKLSDLPPPPPSDYSDYVPCPHCGRKFSSSAAERHIPKCVNIINNKPKGGLQKNAGLKQTSKLLHAPSPSVRGRK